MRIYVVQLRSDVARYPQTLGGTTLWGEAPVPGSDAHSAPGRPAVFVLLFILLAVLFGLGFLNALWWVAAGLLVFALVHYGRGGTGGRGRGSDSDYGEYRDYRDRQNRWDRRYRRQRRGRWMRQDRRDREHHR